MKEKAFRHKNNNNQVNEYYIVPFYNDFTWQSNCTPAPIEQLYNVSQFIHCCKLNTIVLDIAVRVCQGSSVWADRRILQANCLTLFSRETHIQTC